ncbi:GNAT family N-acetyltransferase [Nocardia altamirensis]|uniref:GNAT family N-acetyltransferase n=1 Tax=Nocardia altamirensis TaxID=472158 RepID=UPI00157D0FD5|nr:GNAT family N-acetyltransferase [Nocardia altamirensis]
MADFDIRPMRPDDMAAACDVLAFAFADNPNALAVVGGDPAKAARMMRSGARIGKLGRAFAEVLVAEYDGAVVGVLNAAPWPHCQMGTRERLRIAPRMIGLLRTALPRAATGMRIMAEHDPHEPHWHLGPIGVHPIHQGKGIGRQLLAVFLQQVDDQQLPAHLETDVDRNVLLYQSFGFDVVGTAMIHGVDNRFMWRKAQAPHPF